MEVRAGGIISGVSGEVFSYLVIVRYGYVY